MTKAMKAASKLARRTSSSKSRCGCMSLPTARKSPLGSSATATRPTTSRPARRTLSSRIPNVVSRRCGTTALPMIGTPCGSMRMRISVSLLTPSSGVLVNLPFERHLSVLVGVVQQAAQGRLGLTVHARAQHAHGLHVEHGEHDRHREHQQAAVTQRQSKCGGAPGLCGGRHQLACPGSS